MESVLVRQAVIRMSESKFSTMLSNYELAYALGILLKQSGNEVPEHSNMSELKDKTMELLKEYKPENSSEERLIHMIKLYYPDNRFDDGIKELLQMGLNESRMWIR